MSPAAIHACLAAIPLPCLAVAASERIVAANEAAAALLNTPLVGLPYMTMLRQPALLDAVAATLSDGAARSAHYVGNDGLAEHRYSVSVSPVDTDAGDATVIISFSDLSQLEHAGQVRRDFVANVSHELRTPLTSLLGFIETLRGPARSDPATADRFLGIMQSEALRMNRLIGDLLSLSRVESQARVRPTGAVELVGLIASVAASLAPLAAEADMRIETDFASTELTVAGDADQLRQVFTNLLENGIKYAASGKRLVVGLTPVSRAPVLRAPAVSVTVRDFGPGIDPIHLPRITERFYRVDDHRSRALGGTGLGLAIVKHIVNRHRGRLKVDSTMGKGTTFSIFLPLDKPQNAVDSTVP